MADRLKLCDPPSRRRTTRPSRRSGTCRRSSSSSSSALGPSPSRAPSSLLPLAHFQLALLRRRSSSSSPSALSIDTPSRALSLPLSARPTWPSQCSVAAPSSQTNSSRGARARARARSRQLGMKGCRMQCLSYRTAASKRSVLVRPAAQLQPSSSPTTPSSSLSPSSAPSAAAAAASAAAAARRVRSGFSPLVKVAAAGMTPLGLRYLRANEARQVVPSRGEEEERAGRAGRTQSRRRQTGRGS